MNPLLNKLHPYPFEKLAELKRGISTVHGEPHIALSIGEPKHPPPAFVIEELSRNMDGLGAYPMAKGIPELREAAVGWLQRRYGIKSGSVDADTQVLPVTGTREGLFSFVQAVVDPAEHPVVLIPNPFYQIYEGAAFLAGATPFYLNTTQDNSFLPDLGAIPAEVLKHAKILFICTPGNPTGAVMDMQYLHSVLEFADRHGLIIASDECYAEIYNEHDNPPPSLLQACLASGRDDLRRCLVFHSLSKRSNLPGLRSGFVVGDRALVGDFLLYRTYHGCAMPLPAQRASIVAWNDDRHVVENRQKYREKFATARRILEGVVNLHIPPAAFYLWLNTPVDDESFTRDLYAAKNVTALPGSYLSRETENGNPGKNRIRISLVADVAECAEAMTRLREFWEAF